MKYSPLLLTLAALAAILPTAASAALSYSELVSGDLSSNNLAPTPLAFTAGVNNVSGTMGADPGEGIPLDRDFFSFTIAPGEALTSINVLQFNPPGASFYAIAAGTSINITSPENHLSNILITGSGEILDDLDAGAYNGGVGLDAPLGPGTYTIWFQELAAVVTYEFAYTIEAAPIPEPGTTFIGGALGLIALTYRRRAMTACTGALALAALPI